MDPGHVLVADALDAVVAEPVAQQGGALEGLAGGQPGAGEPFLEIISGPQGPARAGGGDVPGQPLARGQVLPHQFLHGRAGDVIVPHGVAHLVELVEDGADPGRISRSSQHLSKISLTLDSQPGVAMTSPATVLSQSNRSRDMLLGQDGDGLAGQEGRDIGPAPAVVAGGGPDRLGLLGIELAGGQPGGQAAVGGPHLVGPGGKPASGQNDDPEPGSRTAPEG